MESTGLPRSTFNCMQHFFRHRVNLDTEYLIQRRVDFLSDVKARVYDMCINTCCLFVGTHADYMTCDLCHTPRYNANSKPVCRFTYLPVIPRLHGWFECKKMVELMSYWQQYVHIVGETSDAFDGENYCELHKKLVMIDGETLGHKYFSDGRDVALDLSTDGFQVSNNYYSSLYHRSLDLRSFLQGQHKENVKATLHGH